MPRIDWWTVLGLDFRVEGVGARLRGVGLRFTNVDDFHFEYRMVDPPFDGKASHAAHLERP